MSMKSFYRMLNGAKHVYYDEHLGVLSTWDGESTVREFDESGKCVDVAILEEPKRNWREIEQFMIEWEEGLERKE